MEIKNYAFLILLILLVIFLDDQIFLGIQVPKNRYFRLMLLLIGVVYYIFGLPTILPVNPILNVSPF